MLPAVTPKMQLAIAQAPVATNVPEAVVAASPALETGEFPVPPTPAFEPAAAETAAEAAEFAVHPQQPVEEEIDISAEWEGVISEQPASAETEETVESQSAAIQEPTTNEEAIAEAIEEIRFYLANGMTEEAQAELRKLRRLQPEPSKLAAIRDEIEAAVAKAPASERAEAVSVEEMPQPEEEVGAVPETDLNALGALRSHLESSVGEEFLPPIAAQEARPEAQKVEVQAEAALQGADTLNEFVSDLEASLGDNFLAEAPVAPEPETPPEAVPTSEPTISVPASMAAAAAQTGAAVQSLGTAPAFSYQPAPIRPLAPAAHGGLPPATDTGARVDLAGMFGELKHELEEESASTEEDPETHYNLGVAFREMGLLDEAIAELQKVCQAAERGQTLPQIMQTYTWLAQCFLDKGVPEAAIRWYEKALRLPSLDQDTRTALHYELASSYEAAGKKSDALNHFMEVYGSNIDYRDVAERVKTLKS
jgi:tetratricopeptide (TPR) repeat protein